MRSALTEDVVAPTSGPFTNTSYFWPSLTVQNTSTVTRASGGHESTIRRAPGPVEPLREKPFTRTLINVVRMNGDISFFVRATSLNVRRLQGSFSSSGVSGTVQKAILGTSLGIIPANVTAFFSRYSATVPAVSVDLRSQAEVKALNKLRDQVDLADLSFGQIWGERRETCELVETLMVGTANVIKALLRKDYGKSASVLREAFGVSASPAQERARMRRVERRLRKEARKVPSRMKVAVAGTENAILAYNLGISPLVQDVKAAVKALSGGNLSGGFLVESKATYSSVINDEISWFADPDPRDQTCKCLATVAETHGYTVTLRCRPRFDNLSLLSRLGIADPSLIWELTSLSFVVDYHLAVGPWLESLNALHEFEWVDGSYTQRVIRNIRVTASSKLIGLGKASGVGLVNHTKRTVYSSMPVPMPPMSYRNRNLSSTDSQDAAAKRALNQAALASRFIRDALSAA